MRRLRYATILLAVSLVACGDDSGSSNDPVTPPETPDRSLPVVGAPETDEWEEPPPPDEFVPEDRVDGEGAGECCTVNFAFAPDFPEQVETAVLRGSVYPLNAAEGIALQEADGVWSGEACIAPDQFATYYYAVELRTGGEDTFSVVRHNPNAPITTSAGEEVNFWEPADDCASADIAIHAATE